MKEKVKQILVTFHPQNVTAVFNTFLKDESISGKLILGAAVLSLIVVNSPLRGMFDDFWHVPLSIGLGELSLSMDLRHWLNEGLMAFFFLVVGLEIKRELVRGELRDFRAAILPIGAAVGGMVIPALIYMFFNVGTDAFKGWGIPIATDIAFAVAVLALFGKRIPVALKIFLLTLAIADDIGAIVIIALFYAEIIHYGYLMASVLIVIAIFLFRKQLINHFVVAIAVGITLWLTTHLSGIHASIVGVAMGLIAPVITRGDSIPISVRAEKIVLPFSAFVVLPLFAFANAGFVLSPDALVANQPVIWGIIGGLTLGKVIGITAASWLLTKLGIAKLPASLKWRHIMGVGFLAGIGFTVSIFITELAFHGDDALIASAKIGIFIASGLSALLGAVMLLFAGKIVGQLNEKILKD